MASLRRVPSHALALCVVLLASVSIRAAEPDRPDFSTWRLEPENFLGATIEPSRVTLEAGKRRAPDAVPPARWDFLMSPVEYENVMVAATVTIQKPAKEFRFFGEGWSVWPDHKYADQGFEAAIVLRAGERETHPRPFGYRVELSHKYQNVALVKYPDGGYLRVVPCDVKLDTPQRVEVEVRGPEIMVRVDGTEKIRFRDTIGPLTKGHAGIGASSQAKVAFENVQLTALPTAKTTESAGESPRHVPRFAVRNWLGGRKWVFDGDEPVLLLPVPAASYINNVKLRPGYKPQLSWNSHWDIANQGAFPEGTNKNSDVTVSGGGESLTARWIARQTKDRFEIRTALAINFDHARRVYTYDVDSELEVLPGEPFNFRYGYDFEHHTPLDPFNWQYLVVRREGEVLNHRPVYPIDPGPMSDVESYHGLRMWYGRHNERLVVAPAVEYRIDPQLNRDADQPDKPKVRKLSTAVCAAFYDTGVSFQAETAKPGTIVRAKYRYTGYPAEEAQHMFTQSTIYSAATLDPEQYYIFADEWPTLTFSQHVPLSKTWQYGHTPFMTSHNQRPTYELARDAGVPSGFAMRLGPGSFGAAKLPLKEYGKQAAPLKPGRYVLTAQCRSDNAHGPGGRIELTVIEAKTGKPLNNATHYIGNDTFGWKTTGFAFDVPQDGCGLTLGFGNAGTGTALFATVNFQRLEDGAPLPTGIAAKPNDTPASTLASPSGAVADYRMEEGVGQYAFNFATGPFRTFELANLDWTVDEGRPALRFADNPTGRRDYPRYGSLDMTYMQNQGYKTKQTVPVAVSGRHGDPIPWGAFTISTQIKPSSVMGDSGHKDKGDIIGLGARQFILGLKGHKAPYHLWARLNVNDSVVGESKPLNADQWYHVAMSCQPNDHGQWQVKLYVDGELVGEGETKKLPAPTTISRSIILGTEIFYFHDAYYRGLIGRTLIFDRALGADEIATVSKLR